MHDLTNMLRGEFVGFAGSQYKNSKKSMQLAAVNRLVKQDSRWDWRGGG